jgi:adenylate cyclase
MLALIETTDADELLPQLRVGVAFGPAVSRAGDWFGSPVNLASRVTSAARPGSVLVAESAREQIADDDRYLFSFAGSRRLRGVISDVRLYRVRPAG